jgi:hypothetical protein
MLWEIFHVHMHVRVFNQTRPKKHLILLMQYFLVELLKSMMMATIYVMHLTWIEYGRVRRSMKM